MIAKVFWGLGAVLLMLLVISVFTYLQIDNGKNKARDIAINYLQSTYLEQMNPVKVRLSLNDPAMYHIYFTSQSNPDLSFEVLIMLDFTLPRGNPDNYLLKYFELKFTKDIQSIVDDFGKEDIAARVIFLHQPLYAFRVPETIKEDMPYREMEPYIDYDLRFDVNKIWADTDKYAEACIIYEVIESIQASGYSPEQITFSYRTANKERSKIFTLYEWDNIDNVSQVEGLLN